MEKQKKKKTGTIILIVLCIIGLSALLYPTVANYWNENYTTKAVNHYIHVLNEISEEEYQRYWDEADAYNAQLRESGSPFSFYDAHYDEYMSALNPDGSNIMGYIEIPKIDISLPIYHTTATEVLMTAVGHVEWTSLPAGGEGTHSALSGHRGLASAKLFTNLDVLTVNDQFTLHIMNKDLTYEVDQIRTVLPNDVSELAIVPGRDYCTLITCTPYGVNTHRLLVRGHRVQNDNAEIRLVSEAIVIDPLLVATLLAIPLLFTLFMMVMLKKPEKKPDISQYRSK